MAKSETVLALEGSALWGVRLDAEGESFVRTEVDSWSLVASADQLEGGSAEDATEKASDEAASEQVVEEDQPLARAFRDAAKKFGVREFALALPLSKLLVKTVRLPVEAREDLLGAAQLELDAISPFPDEVLTPGAEIVAETDKELVVIVAALPESAAAEISEALAAAKVHVTTTDITAFGWLRALWPQLCAKTGAAHRLVLLNLDGGWDLVLLDDDAPRLLRGLGSLATAAELGREVMLSLMQSGGASNVDDVVVCTREPVAEDVRSRLAAFGPIREVRVEDGAACAEGVARRAVEGAPIDVTPESWREARTECQFRRKLVTWLAVACGLWLAVMGVLFGVDVCYDMMKDTQVKLQRETKHRNAFKEVADMTNKVALIERYADHAHGALEILKTVSECLPASEDMTFRGFQYRRDESVRVNGTANEREDLRTFTERLEAAHFEDDKENTLFAKVQQSGGETQTKKGIRFTMECFFHGDDEEAPKPKAKKGGRK